MKSKIILILLLVTCNSFSQIKLDKINTVLAKTPEGLEINLMEYAQSISNEKPVIIITSSREHCFPCLVIIVKLIEKQKEEDNFKIIVMESRNGSDFLDFLDSYDSFKSMLNYKGVILYDNLNGKNHLTVITKSRYLPKTLITYKGKVIYYKQGWGKYSYKSLVDLFNKASIKIKNSTNNKYPSILGLKKL